MVGSSALVTSGDLPALVGQCANQMIRYSALSSLTLNGDAYIDRGVGGPYGRADSLIEYELVFNCPSVRVGGRSASITQSCFLAFFRVR